ncbi:MAG: tyrosine-type recombinase/integrase [Comamonas sp.]
MDSMAAHSDGYSPRCSCTMRTARSRTSGENLFDFFMAQSSQSVEPPQIPGRFSMRSGEVGLALASQADAVFELDSAHTKNGLPRIVPIHPRVAHIVRNPRLWPVTPTKWTVSKAFKEGARKAGLGHARLHDLRHSTASEMINAGVDLYTVGGGYWGTNQPSAPNATVTLRQKHCKTPLRWLAKK